LLAAALRGSGNVRVPAVITFAGAVVLVPLSPSLIFGLGPMPRLGIAGAGTAFVLYYLAASAALIWYLRSRRGSLYLSLERMRLKAEVLGDILRVGGLSAIGTIQTNLTVILLTGAVGLFGADAIAGYGIASRLDYLQIPLLFGLGTAVVTMIGTNIGAQQFVRARRIAWIGGLLALGCTEALGLATAVFPYAWLGLFTHSPGVLAAGTLYLRTVAPVYGFSGLGLVLYFASQGAGRVGWPVFAGTLRLALAAGGGWFVVARLGASLSTLFLVVAASAVVYGGITAVAVRRAMPEYAAPQS
jgi:Na+-driven multidrug efflux pump